MKYILALDQGTTSSRAIVFDHAGSIIAVAQKEFPQIFPKPGWVEHDPQRNLVHAGGRRSRGARQGETQRATDIAAIGITNQRETTVVWDRATGKPICNAIVWQDRRTAAICDRLKKREPGIADSPEDRPRDRRLFLRDEAPVDSGERERRARQSAKAGQLAFGTVDSWLVWNLTGGKAHVTDASNASRTMLFNIHTGEWDEELLKTLRRAALDVARGALLERSVWRDPLFGRRRSRSPALRAISRPPCSARSAREPGMVKNTYGTGCFMLMNTGAKPYRVEKQSAHHGRMADR